MLVKKFTTTCVGLFLASGICLGANQPTDQKDTLNQYAAGIALGDPSGLTAAASFEDLRINGALAWGSGSSSSYFYIHIDGVKEYPMEESIKGANLFRYFGVGIKTESRSSSCDDCEKSSTGVRLPLGLKAQLVEFPVNIFAELSPGLKLIPKTEIDVDIALGARYRF